MRYRHPLIPFLLVWLALLTVTAWAQSPSPTPQPPQLPVRGYILEDFHSGQVLAQMNADERLEPASITKLMTAYVVYQALEEGSINLDDPVTISEKAWRMEGSRMFIEVGTQVPVRELILGMVVQSGNDATVALAEHVAGTEQAFVALMNQQADRLGLTDSHYMNTTGLPHPEHYTTAQDIATLTRALIEDFPDYYRNYAQKEYRYNDITQHNRNRLLWQDESVDGVKTGHTSSAGYCLAASARRGDTRLISVVLGADSEKDRFSASQALLNYGFRFFETYKLYGAGEPLTQIRVWKGQLDELPLGLAEDLYVTIPEGRYQDLQPATRFSGQVEAPIDQGTVLGDVVVSLDDETVAQAPLEALQKVPESGLVGRLMDQSLMLFHSLWE
ncbi:MAG: D-alanyl-D-alanine carboxypeptidase family protein [Candidatus Competibacteraceae bacterium]|nr:D-alanyl-D-alanine carboxypeptidase family protein [Candidatus Competibacteraceae bacterium]